jgi:MoaA/NifB/PqqE/SkfB family radical SAM enzyme
MNNSKNRSAFPNWRPQWENQSAEAASRDTHSKNARIIFKLTNLCNFNCPHCIRETRGTKYHIPVEIVEKTLKEAQLYRNIDTIAFTGGEPTLHPNFGDIVRLVVEHEYLFEFVTNGWNFQGKTFAIIQPFKEHIKHVNLSLDGATEESHDTIRRQPGSFRRIMQSIILCRFHEIPVTINTVISRANRTELEDIALLISRMGCKALGYAHCQPTPDGLAAGLILNTQERRQVEFDVADLQKTFRIKIVLAGDHYNEAPFYQCPQMQMQEFNIDYQGRLTFCCMLSGYRGGLPDTDVLADLSKVSFYEAHRRLVARIAEVNMDKINLIEAQDSDEPGCFVCSHCLNYFRKVLPHEQ